MRIAFVSLSWQHLEITLDLFFLPHSIFPDNLDKASVKGKKKTVAKKLLLFGLNFSVKLCFTIWPVHMFCFIDCRCYWYILKRKFFFL